MSSVNLGKRAVKLPEEYKRKGECHEHNTAYIVSGTSFGTGGGTHFADQNKSSKGRRGMTWPESVQWFRSFVMPWWARKPGSRERSWTSGGLCGLFRGPWFKQYQVPQNTLGKLARGCR